MKQYFIIRDIDSFILVANSDPLKIHKVKHVRMNFAGNIYILGKIKKEKFSAK
jgi:hypothetical protein